MTRRDRQLLLGLAGLVLGLVSLTLVGVDSNVLLLSPVLVFALPLFAGRYVGEERLARMAAAFVRERPRPTASLEPAIRRVSDSLPRGGRLIAASLAVRPPPARPVLLTS